MPRQRGLTILAAAAAGRMQVLSSEEQECPPLPGGIAAAPSAVPSVGPAGVTALVHPAAGSSDGSVAAAGGSKAAVAGQQQQQHQGQHPVYVAQQEQQPVSMQQVAIGMPPMPHLG